MLPIFNFNSKDHLSALFFSGKVKVTVKEPIYNSDGTFLKVKTGLKAGQVKVKNVDKELSIFGVGLQPLESWKTLKEGVYQTNEGVLNLISKGTGDAAEIAKLMLENRRLQKLISTYYNRTEELLYNDNVIRGRFNHTATVTGRLSSDLQQVPRANKSNVKKMYVSRYALKH